MWIGFQNYAMVTVFEINKDFTFCTITKTWLQITCGCWWWDRQCPTGSNLLLSFAHLSPLFLVWGTQKNLAVNNSWNRRESSSYIICGTGSLWTPSVHPLLLYLFFSLHFLFYSHSTCLYHMQTQRSIALRHSQCSSSINARETNYNNISMCDP